MNINKFTQNSLQAVQNCEKIAADNGNQDWRRSICSTRCSRRTTA